MSFQRTQVQLVHSCQGSSGTLVDTQNNKIKISCNTCVTFFFMVSPKSLWAIDLSMTLLHLCDIIIVNIWAKFYMEFARIIVNVPYYQLYKVYTYKNHKISRYFSHLIKIIFLFYFRIIFIFLLLFIFVWIKNPMPVI